jgi:hypothetical protein
MPIVYNLMKTECACFEVDPNFLVNFNGLQIRTTKGWLVKMRHVDQPGNRCQFVRVQTTKPVNISPLRPHNLSAKSIDEHISL